MLGSCSITNGTSVTCYPENAIPFPRKTKAKYTVCVEGNIGCGKSTFLEYFKKSPNVEAHIEPVSLWKDVRGHNTLELMYQDSQRWSLTFQSYVQLTMLQIHSAKHQAPVKLMERSIYSSRFCFIENLYQGGHMPAVDYSVLNEWFQWIKRNENVGVDLIVYLQASPQTCQDRIQERARGEEAKIPLNYLQALHELHEKWLIHGTQFEVPCPVLVLDADKDLQQLHKDYERRKTEILCGYN